MKKIVATRNKGAKISYREMKHTNKLWKVIMKLEPIDFVYTIIEVNNTK